MMKALGINIYGGGFTIGVQKHFEVIGQWEEIKLGMKTFDLNFKNIYRPLSIYEWPVLFTEADFVYANPPCVPWSMASVWKGRTKKDMFNDKRLILTQHTMDAALAIEPKIFISESVENAYNIGKSHYDDLYVQKWVDKGYQVTYFLNDAIIQGAPCVRRRFHFIASKYKLQLSENPGKFKVNTVKDAIGDIVEVNEQLPQHKLFEWSPSLLSIWPEVREYGTLISVIKSKPNWTGNRPGFLFRKLAWNFPACTMVRPWNFHPIAPRWLTMRETLRLCTYPDDFIVNGSNGIEAVDAVIPVVSEFLARTAKNTLEAAEPLKNRELKVIDWRPFAKPYHFKR